MENDAKLWKICMDIYRQSFKEATPSADFGKMVNSGEAKQPDFYSKYYLPSERLDEIVEAHIKKHHLGGFDARKIENTIYLGCSPSGVKPSKKVI